MDKCTWQTHRLFNKFYIRRLILFERRWFPIAYVTVDSPEELERAIKKFKRQVEKEGIIREWKKREFYEKPSTIKCRRKKALKRKQMKKQRKNSSSKWN